MEFDLGTAVGVFIIGLIVCFISAMLLGDGSFTGIAIIYLAAVIAGSNRKVKNESFKEENHCDDFLKVND